MDRGRMPAGRYLHLDPVAGTPAAIEEFSSATGPAGWRYAAVIRDPDGRARGRVDVTIDTAGRQLRVDLAAGGWRIRGGVTGPDTVWLRSAADGTSAAEQSAAAAGFTGRSPAFALATARRLRLEPGGRARLRLVEVTGAALATALVDREWRELGVTEHPTETGPLPVTRYQVADLATGEVQILHVAGDVLVAGPAVELAALDGPPTRT